MFVGGLIRRYIRTVWGSNLEDKIFQSSLSNNEDLFGVKIIERQLIGNN